MTLMTTMFVAMVIGVSATEVVHVTSEDMLFDNKHTFAKFFAPWCGHCKKMRPDWDRIASNNMDKSIAIADVDCTENKDLCSKFNVRGYPTLMYFPPGSSEPIEYDSSERTFEKMSEWISSETSIKCSKMSLDECDDEEQEFMKIIDTMKTEERVAELEKMKKMISDTEKEHDALLETLQKQFAESNEKLGSLKKTTKKKIKLINNFDATPTKKKDEL